MTSTPLKPSPAAAERAASRKSAAPVREYDPLAGILAVLLPGLGHFVRGGERPGHRARGVYACVGVLGMFFGGLLISGIDAVDSRDDRVWFIGQALVGPIAIVVDRVHQSQFKAFAPDTGTNAPRRFRSGYPNEVREYNSSTGEWVWQPQEGASPPNQTSVTTIKDIGTLYCTLAGMLNLIIILDALMPIRAGQREDAS